MWSSMPGGKEVLVGLHAHMASCILLPAGHSEAMHVLRVPNGERSS